MSAAVIFGRYQSGHSFMHRLDPRTKVLGTLALVVIVFLAQNFLSLGFLALAFLALSLASKISPAQLIRSIAPLVFIIILTMIFNLVFVQGGQVYLDFGWLKVSYEGIYTAVFIGLRLLLLLLSGSLLTLTTTTLDITEALEELLAPLGRIGVPTHEFAFVIGLALRFLPLFIDEFQDIKEAQRARGARLSTSPTRSGLTWFLSLLVPLFASVFRHAEILSSALDARCYRGAIGRTRLHPLHFRGADAIAALALVVVMIIVLVLNRF